MTVNKTGGIVLPFVQSADFFARKGDERREKGALAEAADIRFMNTTVGATVAVEERGTTWCHVTHNGRSGWMMTAFLRFAGQDLSDRIAALEKRIALVEKRLSALPGGEG